MFLCNWEILCLKAHVHPRCIARLVLQRKTFCVVENCCLQCVESIFVTLPQLAKSGFFFWYFSLYVFGYFGLLSSLFVSVSVCFTALLSMAAPDQNVLLKDCADGSRRSTFVSVNPFLLSLERWERSSWLQILQTGCLLSSFYIECSIVNKGPVEISWKQNKRVSLTSAMLYLASDILNVNFFSGVSL